MSHRSVVSLIEDTAKSLADNIQFGYGRRSDFNIIKSKSYPYIWLLPLTATPRYAFEDTENYMKTWNCIVLFLAEDNTSNDETEYKPILDDLDDLLDKFVNRLNDYYLKTSDTVGAITLRGFQQTPFLKDDADILSGWFLSFQLQTSNDFNFCVEDNIALYGNIPPA